jgi:hypothetical protein
MQPPAGIAAGDEEMKMNVVTETKMTYIENCISRIISAEIDYQKDVQAIELLEEVDLGGCYGDSCK